MVVAARSVEDCVFVSYTSQLGTARRTMEHIIDQILLDWTDSQAKINIGFGRNAAVAITSHCILVSMMMMPQVACGGLLLAVTSAFVPVRKNLHTTRNPHRFQSSSSIETDEVVDVIVIGAGIGGLSCAGLSAYYGHSTVCLEAHDTAGGVAHSFVRKNKHGQSFEFDSGPSLISGLSSVSTNPLRQVLDALDVADDITWNTYDGWIIHDTSDQTNFKVTTGDSGAWEDAIEQKAGTAARREFEAFKEEMLTPGGLSESYVVSMDSKLNDSPTHQERLYSSLCVTWRCVGSIQHF